MNEESVNGHFPNANDFVTKARAKGYKWCTYQLNDVNLGPQQYANAPAYRAACEGKIIFTGWFTRPFNGPQVRQACVELGLHGIILEGEIPSEWINPSTGLVEPKPDAVDWVDMIWHLKDLNIPKAVVTNNAPFVHHDGKPWPDKAAPLIQDGWAYISENFITEAPSATPAATHDYATRVLGWATTQPMIEAWHIQDYGDMSIYPNVSHWDAGNVLF